MSVLNIFCKNEFHVGAHPIIYESESPSVMADSLRPHRLEPARLLCPWGFSRQEYWSGLLCPSPGDLPIPGIEPRSPTLQTDSLPSEPPGKPIKSGGGGLIPQSCPTLCDPMDCSLPGSSVHGDSPGQNTGVGSRFLLQGIFPTQGSDPGLPHCRQILYHLSHQGSPANIKHNEQILSAKSLANTTHLISVHCV